MQELFNRYKQSNLKLYLAMYQEKPVGALLCALYKDTVSAWVGGIRSESNAIESNELLHWEVLKEALVHNFKWFEIIGANTRHLCDFKAKFNPRLSIMFQVKKMDLLGSTAERAYTLMQKRSFSTRPKVTAPLPATPIDEVEEP